MALSEIEKEIGRQIKAQGGTKDDFREALTEYRKRQKTLDTTGAKVADSLEKPLKTQPIESVSEGISGKVSPEEIGVERTAVLEKAISDRVSDEVKQEKDEGLTGFIAETGESAKTRLGNVEEIGQRLKDKNVKSREEIQRLAQEGDSLGAFIESAKGSLGRLGSAFQLVGQGAGFAGDVAWESVENAVQELTPEKAETVIEESLQSAVETDTVQDVAKSYAEFRERNPETARNLEAVGNIGGLLLGLSKSGGQAARSAKEAKLLQKAADDIDRFIKPTGKKTKLETEKITPEFLEKLRKGEIQPGTREQVQAVSQARAKDFGQQIQKVVDEGLQGSINRDDLLNVLDNLRKQGTVDGKVVDDQIVNATDKMADIIGNFPQNIPADKARELRQVFDSAVFKGRGPITEEALTIKNTIKKRLADNLRKQLAEQNPSLANLNREYSFYTNLDDLLQETIVRTKGQAEGGGIETKRSGTLRAVAGGTGAGVGSFVGGAQGGFIGGAIGVAAANKLDEILASPSRKILQAADRAKLADAIVNGNKQKAKEVINKMARQIGIAELPDEEQE